MCIDFKLCFLHVTNLLNERRPRRTGKNQGNSKSNMCIPTRWGHKSQRKILCRSYDKCRSTQVNERRPHQTGKSQSNSRSNLCIPTRWGHKSQRKILCADHMIGVGQLNSNMDDDEDQSGTSYVATCNTWSQCADLKYLKYLKCI